MPEIWRPVRELPDHYEVSSLGRIKAIGGYHPSKVGKIRKPQITKNGYVVYMLSADNKIRLRSAHRLVADAFLGPIQDGMQVNHKNGIKGDPRLINLEIVTKGENRAHSYQVLGIPPNRGAIGLKNPHATLTFDQVQAIRSKYAAGVPSSKLASEYGISRQGIWRIATNRGRLKA